MMTFRTWCNPELLSKPLTVMQYNKLEASVKGGGIIQYT